MNSSSSNTHNKKENTDQSHHDHHQHQHHSLHKTIFDNHAFQRSIQLYSNRITCISNPLMNMMYSYIYLNYANKDQFLSYQLSSNILHRDKSLEINAIDNQMLSDINKDCFVHNVCDVSEQQLTDELQCLVTMKMFVFTDETSDNPAHYLLDEEYQKHRFIDLIFMDVVNNSSDHMKSINNNLKYLKLNNRNQDVTKLVNKSFIVSLLYMRLSFHKTYALEYKDEENSNPIINDMITCRYASNQHIDVVILDTVGDKFQVILVSVKKGMEAVVRETDLTVEVTKMQMTQDFVQVVFPLINKDVTIEVEPFTRQIYFIDLSKELKELKNITQLITLQMDENGINVSETLKRKRSESKEKEDHQSKTIKLKKQSEFSSKSKFSNGNKRICFDGDIYMFLCKFRKENTSPIQSIVSVYIPKMYNPLYGNYYKSYKCLSPLYVCIKERLSIFEKHCPSSSSSSVIVASNSTKKEQDKNIEIDLSIFNIDNLKRHKINKIRNIFSHDSDHSTKALSISIWCTSFDIGNQILQRVISLINNTEIKAVNIYFSDHNTELEQLYFLLCNIKCIELTIICRNTFSKIKTQQMNEIATNIGHFINSNLNLKKLSIMIATVITQTHLIDAINKAVCLKELHFSHISFDNFGYISRATTIHNNLTKLHLSNTQLDQGSYHCLSYFVNLTDLKISCIFDNTQLDCQSDYFSFITKMKYLISFNIQGLMDTHAMMNPDVETNKEKIFYFFNNLFSNLKKSCSITKLVLSHCPEIFHFNRDDFVDFVGQYTRLKSLYLTGIKAIRYELLDSIINTSEINKLYISKFKDNYETIKTIEENRFLFDFRYENELYTERWEHIINYVLSINYLNVINNTKGLCHTIRIEYYGLLCEPIPTIIMTLLLCIKTKERQWRMIVPRILIKVIIKILDYHSWIDMVANKFDWLKEKQLILKHFIEKRQEHYRSPFIRG